MRQEEFHKVLKRYKNGLCTPEEEALVEKWFRAMESTDGSSVPSSGRAEIKERSWTRIQRHILRTRRIDAARMSGKQSRNISSRSFWAVATTVLVIVSSGIFLITNLPGDDEQKDSLRALTGNEISNDTDSAMEVRLEDGSTVLLEPRSSIVVEPFNDSQRLVALEGEAFFTVSKDPSRPFLVNTNELITKVLGTSFTVSAFPDDENITVSVVTGKVSVMTRTDKDADSHDVSETILTPNQKIIYNRSNNLVSRMIVKEPVPILPPEVVERMHFEAAPIGEIFEGLEQVYGVDIEFDEQVFSSCILTTSIAEGSIYDRLDMICKAIDARYFLRGDHIVITGGGCKQ